VKDQHQRFARFQHKALGPCVLLFGLAFCAGNVCLPYYRVIDDAYISYRYSRHVAQGEGLVWNPGEAPVEGFTNFLLVMVEVPVIAAGLDPLKAAQWLSLLSVLLIAFLIFDDRRRVVGASWWSPGPALAASVFLCIPIYGVHVMMGLETMVAAVLLVTTYWMLARFLEAAPTAGRAGYRFYGAACLCGWLAGLARPENFAVAAAMIGLAGSMDALGSGLSGQALRRLMRWALVAGVFFVIPTLGYHGWRLHYYGDLRPNSYYIKVLAGGGDSLPGLPELVAFLGEPSIAVLAAAAIFRRSVRGADALLLPPLLFCLLFYLRAEHIMAFQHRFFIPFVPFFVLAAVPALTAALEETAPKVRVVNALCFLVVFGYAFVYSSPLYAHSIRESWPRKPVVEETHFMLGRLMAQLPNHRELLVVGPDAGAMPYFSESRWIDPIGLNDNFLARNAGLPAERLIDYLFDRDPDLWILCKRGKNFVNSFPGPLGRHGRRIYRDPRFRRYAYLASFNKNSGGRYQYHYFGKKELPRLDDIRRILAEKSNYRWH